MAGHSHWAGIKHKKARVDAQRGKVFSKLSRAIISAARQGGGDPDANLTLKVAIDAARAANMSKDTIERAIKKGTGELEGEALESVVYEGYWQGGVAVMVDVLTDNRNRTGPEVKKIFDRRGGSVGVQGCVSYLFETKSLTVVPSAGVDEERLFEVAVEAGAEDVQRVGGSFQVVADAADHQRIREALKAAGIPIENAEITRIPKTTVPITDRVAARRMLEFIEELDDHVDVQRTYANFDIPEEVMEEIEKELE